MVDLAAVLTPPLVAALEVVLDVVLEVVLEVVLDLALRGGVLGEVGEILGVFFATLLWTDLGAFFGGR